MFKKVILIFNLFLITCSSCQDREHRNVDNSTEYKKLVINCIDSISVCNSNDKQLKFQVSNLKNGNSEIAFNYKSVKYNDTIKTTFDLGFNSFLYEKNSVKLLIIDEFLEYGHSLHFYKFNESEIEYVGKKILTKESNILSIKVFKTNSGLLLAIKERFENDELKQSQLNISFGYGRKIKNYKKSIIKKINIDKVIEGYWAINCDSDSYFFYGKDPVLSFYDQYRLHLEPSKKDDKSISFKPVYATGFDGKDEFKNEFKNDSTILEIKVIDSNHIEFKWHGYFNILSKKRENYNYCPLGNGECTTKPVKLKKCFK